jgi:hypothetical protein
MSTYHIDRTDQKILALLVKNARMPYLEIARECGVSGAAIHQRVKKLESNGVITGSRLLVKPQAIGLNICAFISISLSEANKYNEVVSYLKKIPEIVECHFVTGQYSIIVKIYCFDNDHLMQVILNTIQKIPYIQATATMISLNEAIERQVWVKDYHSTSFMDTINESQQEEQEEIEEQEEEYQE